MVLLLNSKLAVVTAAVGLSGCLAFQGTRPHDMTGVEHAAAAQSALARGETEAAAAHGRSAEQLKQAEAVACREVPQAEIALGFNGLSIGSVNEVRVARGEGDPEVAGATVLVALQGRSLEQMGRIVHCRAARGAVRGDDGDPLGLPGTSVRVSPGDAGWAVVEVRGADQPSAQQILMRASNTGRRT